MTLVRDLEETNRQQFATRWSKVGVRILTSRLLEPEMPRPYARLQVWLPSLSVEMFVEGLNPIERSEVYQCHRFVGAVARLIRATTSAALINRAEQLFQLGKHDRETLRDQLNSETGASSAIEGSALNRSASFRRFVSRRNVDRALAALPYVSEEMGRYYFAKAREYQAAGILGFVGVVPEVSESVQRALN